MTDLDMVAQITQPFAGDELGAGMASMPGRRRGRPKKEPSPDRLAEVLRLYFVEKLSMRQVADVVGVSHMSVYRMLSDPNVELLI